MAIKRSLCIIVVLLFSQWKPYYTNSPFCLTSHLIFSCFRLSRTEHRTFIDNCSTFLKGYCVCVCVCSYRLHTLSVAQTTTSEQYGSCNYQYSRSIALNVLALFLIKFTQHLSQPSQSANKEKCLSPEKWPNSKWMSISSEFQQWTHLNIQSFH